MPGPRRTWSDAQLEAAVASCTNFTEILRSLGLRPAGGNDAAVRRHAARLELDIAHFNVERRVRGLRPYQTRPTPDEVVFCEGSHVRSAALRRRSLLRLHPRACALCANPGLHNGLPLTLQLDHVNGVHDDNRIENLRWLCPNCHSQTATFAGRKPHQVREARLRWTA